MTDFEHTITDLDFENEYPKLVRDRIPEIIKNQDGYDVPVQILDDSEFEWYLRRKAIEEATELAEADTDKHLLEELADINEIIDEIERLKGFTPEQVRAVQDQKRERRGGFGKRLLMLSNEPVADEKPVMSERVKLFFAYKVFLRDGEKLLITHDIFGDWDLPGGRVRKNEFGGAHEEVISRKMREELGDKVRYEVGEFQTIFQVTRHEHNLDKEVQILALGYAATYLGGEIQLGDHHDKMEWVDVSSFKPENYFTGGWLKGVQEYLKQINS